MSQIEINFEELISRLGAQKSGSSWLAKCLAHNDGDPSLSITQKDEKILLHCQAGCSQEAVIAALRERGLWPKADNKEWTHIAPGIPQKWYGADYVSHWEYRNSAGQELGYVVRYEKSGEKVVIPFFKRDGSKWKSGAAPLPRPLYGLNKLTKQPDSPVIICEGEKASDAAQKLLPGFVVMTSPGGSKAAGKADWTPLRDRSVIIWPDNDKPGKKYLCDVLAQLKMVGAAITGVVDVLALEMPEKGDAADWPTGKALPDPLPFSSNENASKGQANTLHIHPMDSEDGFPEPVPFDDFRTPSIPCDLLPGWAGAYAAAVSEAIQVPPELAIANILGVVSVCVAKKFSIEVKPGYSEPLNHSSLCPLEPGERKSAALAACSKPLLDWEMCRARELEPEVKDAKSKAKTFERMIEHQRGRAAKAKSQEERARIIDDIRELERDMPIVPTVPRLLADDITPEAAAPLMQQNNERLGIMSAEGGLFDLLAGRYSNGIPNLDLFLKAHSGDSARVDRKNGVPVILGSPALTMCLSPQPEVVRGLAEKPGFRGRGFLGRFLYFIPQSMLGRRRVDVVSIPEHVRMAYHSNIESLLDHPWGQDLYGQPAPHVLRLSPGSFHAWREFSLAVELELRDDGKFAFIRDWAGKLPGAAARLAGILHIVEHSGGAIPSVVELKSMDAALSMASLLTSHAQAAFGMMGADLEIEIAKHILEWIQRYKHETFSARDCHRALQGRYRKMSELSPGFDILVERAFIQSIVGDAKPTAGRPASMQYRVNPKVYG